MKELICGDCSSKQPDYPATVIYKGKTVSKIIELYENAGLIPWAYELDVSRLNDFGKEDLWIDVCLVLDEEELTENLKSHISCSDYAELSVFILHNSPAEVVLEKAKSIFSPLKKGRKYNESVKIVQGKTRSEQLETVFRLIKCWHYSKTWHEHLAGDYLGCGFGELAFYSNGTENPNISINRETDFIISALHKPTFDLMTDITLGKAEPYLEQINKYDNCMKDFYCFKKKYCPIYRLDVCDLVGESWDEIMEKVYCECFWVRKLI